MRLAWWVRVVLRLVRPFISVDHVAFIMDGNRRYARFMGLEIQQGHHKGLSKLLEVMEICRCLGVKAITVYAFSLQNFQRSETEVCNLMSLATKTAETDEKLRKDGAFLLRFHGDFRFLMEELRVALDDVERENAKAYAASRYNMSKSGTIVNLCISYGARNEIAIAKEGFRKKDNWNEEEVAEQFYKCLVAGDHCPPQIMIRTSGVTRLSDFLLYQCSEFTTFYFFKETWPHLTMWSIIGAFLHWSFFCRSRSPNYGYTSFKA